MSFKQTNAWPVVQGSLLSTIYLSGWWRMLWKNFIYYAKFNTSLWNTGRQETLLPHLTVKENCNTPFFAGQWTERTESNLLIVQNRTGNKILYNYYTMWKAKFIRFANAICANYVLCMAWGLGKGQRLHPIKQPHLWKFPGSEGSQIDN